jgi:hypothetical protein
MVSTPAGQYTWEPRNDTAASHDEHRSRQRRQPRPTQGHARREHGRAQVGVHADQRQLVPRPEQRADPTGLPGLLEYAGRDPGQQVQRRVEDREDEPEQQRCPTGEARPATGDQPRRQGKQREHRQQHQVQAGPPDRGAVVQLVRVEQAQPGQQQRGGDCGREHPRVRSVRADGLL